MQTTLLIMAAGIGSRFGGGIKQLEPVDAAGHIIMDYSIHDAIEAGFNKVVFIIRKDIENEFKKVIGDRIAGICSEHNVTVDYAFQDINDIPGVLPEGRTKPWGTGQAVLAAKDVLTTPFIVINADDYYGREGFRRIHDYMAEHMDSQSEIYDICMGGFVLSNTLSDNGTVTRGVCQVDEEGYLTNVTETYNIQMKEDGLHATDESGAPVTISPSQPVSMNMWGLPASFVQELEKGFPVFLDNLKEGDIKSEYLLPKIIDNLVQNKKARVTVLDTPDKWFGVTYREDKQAVTDAIRGLIESGVYEEKLFG